MVTFRQDQERLREQIREQKIEVEKQKAEESKAQKALNEKQKKQDEIDRKKKELTQKNHEQTKVNTQIAKVHSEIRTLESPTGEIQTYRNKERELQGVEKSIEGLKKALGMTPDQMAEKLPEAALTRDGINQAFGVDIDINQYRNALAERGVMGTTPLTDSEISTHMKSMDNFSLWQFLIRILGGGEAYQI